MLYCGHETVKWEQVDPVAGYMIIETAFSKRFGFTSAYCWYAAFMTTERIRQPKNWLFMLYLASNFSATDPRDMIYGLRGLMNFSDRAKLLDADYSKSIVNVYRDSVEAVFVNFQNTDVLLYVTGRENPSWIPSWSKDGLETPGSSVRTTLTMLRVFLTGFKRHTHCSFVAQRNISPEESIPRTLLPSFINIWADEKVRLALTKRAERVSADIE